MPRPRFDRAAPRKREALLDAASAEFAAHGYKDASVNRILATAGFSKGSFYYYFDDKADLAAAVVEHESKLYLAEMHGLGRPRTPPEFWREVHRLVDQTESYSDKRPLAMDALTRLGTAAARDPVLFARLTGSAMHEITAVSVAFWKHGQAIGAVRDDLSVETLTALLIALKTALTRALLPHDRAASRDELETYIRVHVDLVRRLAERRDDAAGAKGRRRK
jgi:AcrR family transcriptional regulator